MIGAEKILPKSGLTVQDDDGDTTGSKFIIDGVQAELNPRPSTCRALLGNEIRACFTSLQKEMKKRDNKGVSVDFSRTIEISKEKLMELDEQSRKFGCAPSRTVYRNKAAVKIADVDPTEYRIRAAGGHIHIGKGNYYDGLIRALTDDHRKTVRMLDLLCGNTCVLVDRDEGNKERRKVYGRAGEFRLPEHGLEYRTLSNFWLTAYPLMSLAFGMARLAVQLMADKDHEMYYDAFTSILTNKKVKDAINNNDFNLALSNFRAIEKLLLEVTRANDRYPINTDNINEFYFFVYSVQAEGLSKWFPDDPMTHWIGLGDCHDGGFNDFLTYDVRDAMEEIEEKQTA